MSDLTNKLQREPRRSTTLITAIIAAFLATMLGILTHGPNVLAVDLRLLRAVQKIDFPGLESIVALSNVVFSTLPALIIVVSFVAFGISRRDRTMVAQIVMLAGLRLAGELLKPAFESPRPGPDYQRDPAYLWNTLGYPSGHAFTATLVAGMLVATVMRTGLRTRIRRVFYLLACLIVVIAAFSRIWIGAHWPTDTVGGLLFGISAIAITVFAATFRSPLPSMPSSERS